ncbi:hypothetical protein E2C01_046967 [Portunus trituberculatus]|uniref:Uncharacterized protein n=1 Tax=Portunus trituberculatus TaxID=210409 RepID=A0A5B7G977_PORTR|nr:hypothetical protein [Portunus trituberculatus]
MDRIRNRALGDPSDPKARMVPLYHGDSPQAFVFLAIAASHGTLVDLSCNSAVLVTVSGAFVSCRLRLLFLTVA